MKNQLLLISALGMATLAIGQSSLNIAPKYIVKKGPSPASVIYEGNGKSSFFSTANKMNNKKRKEVSNNVTSTPTLNVIDLGKAGNALGAAFGGRTALWADPNLKAIVFIHRSDPTSTGDNTNGFYRYDYSFDGGATWSADQGPAYSSNGNNAPPFANARYPEGVLYNPTGNSVPDSAFLTFFGPSLTGTNGTTSAGGWGGHVHGTVQISANELTLPRRTEEVSGRYEIPTDFTLTKTGVTFNLDADDDLAGTTPAGYKDSLIIAKGTWNNSKRDFDYITKRLYAPVSKDQQNRPNYVGAQHIVFADNGQTGYLPMITHNSYVFEKDSIFYLSVFKTTDGGTNWSAPVNISLGGVSPLLPASSIYTKYGAGFELDAVVDINGNLHVVMPISLNTDTARFNFITAPGYWGLFDIYTTDGGTNWKAKLLANPETFNGVFGTNGDATNVPITEYNRAQASRNWKGDKLFFTWFDTDTTVFSGVGNQNPDVYSMGYDVTNDKWTAPISSAGSAYASVFTFGEVSYYVWDDNSGLYTVPIAYQELSNPPISTGTTTIFHYLDGMSFRDGDFSIPSNSVLLTSVNDIKENHAFEVSQNYPNPFNNTTSFNLNLTKNVSVSIDVFNTLGQKVISQESRSFTTGSHNVTIDGSSLSPGIYFFTVKAGNDAVTQRMIVK